MQAPLGRRAAAVLAVAAALAGSSLSASGRAGAGSSIDSLRAADAALASKSRSVALELYGLESSLARARSEALAARARLDDVRREAEDTARRLGHARRTLTAAQRNLAERLNALYVEGETDPIEVILGAGSLEDAIARVDGLDAIADHDRSIVASTTRARASLRALRARLAARERSLADAEASAAARVNDLARTAVERRSYLAALAEKRRLGAARIAALEHAAAERARRTAQQTSARTTSRAAVPSSPAAGPPEAAASPAPAPSPAPPPNVGTAGVRTLTVSSTGYALRGTTATGVPVGWGVVAVDPSVIPLGTRMTIPGYGTGVAADTGGAVHGTTIDLWFPSVAQALEWGRRTVTITLH